MWQDVAKDRELDENGDDDADERFDHLAQDKDRFYSFEVAKTKEREESVNIKPGFTVSLILLYLPLLSLSKTCLLQAPLPKNRKRSKVEDVNVDLSSVPHGLVLGETVLGYHEVRQSPSSQTASTLPERFTSVRLKQFLCVRV